MDAIDVVAGDCVHDRVRDELADLGDSGVVVELAVLSDDPVGMRPRRVGRCEPGERAVHAHAIGVEPCVQGEVALVSLVHGECEWVVAGVLALLPGEPGGPWLELRWPEGVGRRPHLEHDGIEVVLDREVEPGPKFGLLLGSGEPGARRPVDIRHRCDPHCPEVVLLESSIDGAGAGCGKRDLANLRRCRRCGRGAQCEGGQGCHDEKGGDDRGREIESNEWRSHIRSMICRTVLLGAQPARDDDVAPDRLVDPVAEAPTDRCLDDLKPGRLKCG